MASGIPLIGTIILIAIFIYLRSKKDMEDHWDEHEARLKQAQDARENSSDTGSTSDTDNVGLATSELMFTILRHIGCQPSRNENNTISVLYQGENFYIEFDGVYARVWDPMWSGIKADDPDLPNAKDAMNSANFNFGPTVVMTKPNKDGVIGFHSRRDIMLHPACPDNVPFVKAVLDSFFDIKEQMRSSYQKLSVQQAEMRKNRRPVGFTINPSSQKS